jgi:hypothetical protein
MKLKNIYEDLLELAKRVGITIRKEQGHFKSGYCIIKEQQTIIFNRGTTIETQSAVIARCLNEIKIDDIYVKPALREFLERERDMAPGESNFTLDIEY